MPDMDSIPAADCIRSRQLRDEEMMFLAKRVSSLVEMLKFLRERSGECLGDHPKWLAKIDELIGDKNDEPKNRS
jgi:hypothetical protein